MEMALKLVLKKQNEMAWAGFMYLSNGILVGCCVDGNERSDSIVGKFLTLSYHWLLEAKAACSLQSSGIAPRHIQARVSSFPTLRLFPAVQLPCAKVNQFLAQMNYF